MALNRLSVSLTTKMFVLVLIAVTPALAIQSFNEYDLRKSREDDIRNKTVQITKQFGAEMGELREGARQYPRGHQPASRRSVRRIPRPAPGLLATLNARTPYYSLLGVADAAGQGPLYQQARLRCLRSPTFRSSCGLWRSPISPSAITGSIR